MMRQEPFHDEKTVLSHGAVGYCDHCGFAVYHMKDMLLIQANGDRIHKDCWLDYAEEHMFEFVKCADGGNDFDCGV